MTNPKDQQREPDELELEVEEIADLEIPHALADDVRGASGTHPTGTGRVLAAMQHVAPHGGIGAKNC